MIGIEWADALGGAATAAVTVAVAFFGWLGMRGSTASATAQWLVGELRQEIVEREEAIAERDARIARLEQHVALMEIEQAKRDDEFEAARTELQKQLAATTGQLSGVVTFLRGVLTADQYDQLLQHLDDDHGLT